MKTDFKNRLEILKYYNDEEKCKALLAQQRWGGKPVCPHCGSDKTYTTTRGYKCADKECYKKFSVTVGTVFENSKIKLQYWFYAIYICTSYKKGVSSHQLARDLDVTQKTAWFILHRVREMLKDRAPEMLTGTVEIDETYIGGLEENKHKDKKLKKSQGGAGKTPVLGILQRDGKVSATPVKNTWKSTLLPIMVSKVEKGSTIYTDEKSSYWTLNKNYNHGFVNHKRKEYVKGQVHTNSIEGFWSLLKRGLHGTYHDVSDKHLSAYCNEFAYRYNTRKQTDPDRFFDALTKIGNFKLPYKVLINKNDKIN